LKCFLSPFIFFRKKKKEKESCITVGARSCQGFWEKYDPVEVEVRGYGFLGNVFKGKATLVLI